MLVWWRWKCSFEGQLENSDAGVEDSDFELPLHPPDNVEKEAVDYINVRISSIVEVCTWLVVIPWIRRSIYTPWTMKSTYTTEGKKKRTICHLILKTGVPRRYVHQIVVMIQLIHLVIMKSHHWSLKALCLLLIFWRLCFLYLFGTLSAHFWPCKFIFYLNKHVMLPSSYFAWHIYLSSLSLHVVLAGFCRYNKTLLGDDLGKFPAPLLMNTVHFSMQAVLSNFITWFWSQRFQLTVSMTWRDYFMRGILVHLFYLLLCC